MSKKSCKKGYYYCYTDEKCKKIPRGYMIGIGGYLRKEKSDDSDEESKNNGNGNGGNGNGNHSNGNGNGNGSSSNGGGDGGGGGVSEAWSAKYKKSIDCDNPKGFSQKAHCRGREKVSEGKNGDHEVAMAQSQLKKSAENIKKVRKALGKKEKDIPAWMQAKITDTAHDTDAAAGYVDKMDEQYMTQQQKAEYMMQRIVNKAKGEAAKIDRARQSAKDVKTTTGSVNVRAEEVIIEKRDGKSAKSKGYSLRDWFKGGGWVQAGGKYDGKPCAKQPGQKTKPYCRDADDRAAMSKKERNKRAAKKRKEDPNPNKKGKAKNVTQESYSNWRQEVDLNEMGIANAIRLGLAAGTAIGGAMIGKKAVDSIKGATEKRNKKLDDAVRRSRGIREGRYSGGGGLRPGDKIKMLDGSLKSLKDIDAKLKEKETKKEEVQMEGKKDACYHKVKSRYSVWPSAYASGALVKCRKVGAKNWGNKTKKEGYEFSNWRDDFKGTEYESVDIIKAEPLKPTDGIGSRMLDEKCWKGYEKKGMKTMFGKRYPNCVKKKKTRKEEVELIDERSRLDGPEERKKDLDKRYDPKGGGKNPYQYIPVKKAQVQKEAKSDGDPCWDTHEMKGMKKKGNRMVPNCVPKEQVSDWRSELNIQEDWQKANRKDKTDGMSQKAVNAYKRENPGSKLKTAVTGNPKKGSKDAKRRKSFCSRSNGQRKMHNIDCSKTPDKKICKARRRWKC